ncbi:transmembrane protein [Anaeramoeba flamelloides]|uniref:Transmembrane protein n=1 Tax=Anaeramoeba flamelloides TaxID=1746091 RepID=A0ABQ8X6P7_9EUKA|nr:transmembrane protein [Anaeramoeba flamelloides]
MKFINEKLFLFFILLILLQAINTNENLNESGDEKADNSKNQFFSKFSQPLSASRLRTFPYQNFDPSSSKYNSKLTKAAFVGIGPGIVIFVVLLVYLLYHFRIYRNKDNLTGDYSQKTKSFLKILFVILTALTTIFFILQLIILIVSAEETYPTLDQIQNTAKIISNQRLLFAHNYSNTIESDSLFADKSLDFYQHSKNHLNSLRTKLTLQDGVIVFIDVLLLASIILAYVTMQKRRKFLLVITIISFLFLSSIYFILFGITFSAASALDDTCEDLNREKTSVYDYFLESFNKSYLQEKFLLIENIKNGTLEQINNLTYPDIYFEETIHTCDSEKYENDTEQIQILKDKIVNSIILKTNCNSYIEKNDIVPLLNKDKICNRLLIDYDFFSSMNLSIGILLLSLATIQFLLHRIYSEEDEWFPPYSMDKTALDNDQQQEQQLPKESQDSEQQIDMTDEDFLPFEETESSEAGLLENNKDGGLDQIDDYENKKVQKNGKRGFSSTGLQGEILSEYEDVLDNSQTSEEYENITKDEESYFIKINNQILDKQLNYTSNQNANDLKFVSTVDLKMSDSYLSEDKSTDYDESFSDEK